MNMPLMGVGGGEARGGDGSLGIPTTATTASTDDRPYEYLIDPNHGSLSGEASNLDVTPG